MNFGYDAPTQFGFPGSAVGVLPSTLDQVNPAYYAQIQQFINSVGGQARLASISGIRLYDSLRIDAGVMPLTTFTFFQNGVSQQQSMFVASGSTYRKQNIDVTYWVDNGKLSKGYEALIWSMQVLIQLPFALDESVQTSGNTIGLPNVPGFQASTGAAIQGGNYMRAILESFYFELFLNNTSFEHGPTYLFPSSYGVGNTNALADGLADGALSNTVGWCYQMPVMRHIPDQTKFGVRMTCQNAWTNTDGSSPETGLNFRVIVILDGIGVQPVTG
jgi:hypothetical protein